jgi:hypothetical protein
MVQGCISNNFLVVITHVLNKEKHVCVLRDYFMEVTHKTHV